MKHMLESIAAKNREPVAAAGVLKLPSAEDLSAAAGVSAQVQQLSQQLTELAIKQQQQLQQPQTARVTSGAAAPAANNNNEALQIIKQLVELIAHPQEQRQRDTRQQAHQQQPSPQLSTAQGAAAQAAALSSEARRLFRSIISWVSRLKGSIPGVSLLQVLLSLPSYAFPEEAANAICGMADYLSPLAGLEGLGRVVSPPARAAAMWERASRSRPVSTAAEEQLRRAVQQVHQHAAATAGAPLNRQDDAVAALLRAAPSAHPMSVVHATRGLGPLLDMDTTLQLLRQAQASGAPAVELAAAAYRCLPVAQANAFCEDLQQHNGSRLPQKEHLELVDELLLLLQQALQLAGQAGRQQTAQEHAQYFFGPPAPPPYGGESLNSLVFRVSDELLLSYTAVL